MDSTTRKITLHPDDVAAADQMPVKAISVIPTVNLDEATVIQRFGQPGERVEISEKRVHLLYPQQGLDVVVDGRRQGIAAIRCAAQLSPACVSRCGRLWRCATGRSEPGFWSASLLK
jgi:hypothetical protein